MASPSTYSKIREIGSGSFGKAILVQNVEGKQFVMKAIDISRLDSRECRDAVNEVKVLASMKHPYVIAYRESFMEGNTICIIMDYAEGGDLHTRIAKVKKAGQSFNESQIVRWFTQAALAMKYMHERHVLHRDLKTQNIFLSAGGRARIGDFGISKVLDNTSAFAKTTIGTPYYMSPEICQERPYSWSSDVWAMGVILFEMCALRIPFDAPNIRVLVNKIVYGPMPVIPTWYSSDVQRLTADLLLREEKRRPSAYDILRYPMIQAEIRSMLMEEQAKHRENDVVPLTSQETYPGQQRTPRFLMPEVARLPLAKHHDAPSEYVPEQGGA